MKDEIRRIFSQNGIEMAQAISYSDVKETNGRLLSRLGFEPRSVIVFLLPYFVSNPENISAYAASLDYHLIIKNIGENIVSQLQALYPDNKFAIFGDHSPIDERAAALGAGLAILGENGLVINEKYGSYVFIADVITDIPGALIGCVDPQPYKKCIGCGACKRACPTGILRGAGEDCLSAITQRKGELTEKEKELMREFNTVWGCDICQKVCPYNKSAEKTNIAVFYNDRIDSLSPDYLNSLSEEEFSRRAFAWRGRAVLERNLQVVENYALKQGE